MKNKPQIPYYGAFLGIVFVALLMIISALGVAIQSREIVAVVDSPLEENVLVSTGSPFAPTFRPTFEPTFEPTVAPTSEPTVAPTFAPTSSSPTTSPVVIGAAETLDDDEVEVQSMSLGAILGISFGVLMVGMAMFTMTPFGRNKIESLRRTSAGNNIKDHSEHTSFGSLFQFNNPKFEFNQGKLVQVTNRRTGTQDIVTTFDELQDALGGEQEDAKLWVNHKIVPVGFDILILEN